MSFLDFCRVRRIIFYFNCEGHPAVLCRGVLHLFHPLQGAQEPIGWPKARKEDCTVYRITNVACRFHQNKKSATIKNAPYDVLKYFNVFVKFSDINSGGKYL